MSSLFSLFKEKSEKPQAEVPDSEDESDEAIVDATELVGTNMVSVKPLLSNSISKFCDGSNIVPALS